jgi:cilia- and flagella-associated protein 57
MQQSDPNLPHEQADEIKIEEPHNMMVTPRFIAGLRTEVKNNIFYLNDNTVLYPVGHNVVIYNTEDKNQKYIPGIEGSEGISALAVSQSKKFLAVAERTDKTAVCVVYSLDTLKRKIISSEDVKQRELVSIAFSPSNEKMLVTLTENLHD